MKAVGKRLPQQRARGQLCGELRIAYLLRTHVKLIKVARFPGQAEADRSLLPCGRPSFHYFLWVAGKLANWRASDPDAEAKGSLPLP